MTLFVYKVPRFRLRIENNFGVCVVGKRKNVLPYPAPTFLLVNDPTDAAPREATCSHHGRPWLWFFVRVFFASRYLLRSSARFFYVLLFLRTCWSESWSFLKSIFGPSKITLILNKDGGSVLELRLRERIRSWRDVSSFFLLVFSTKLFLVFLFF